MRAAIYARYSSDSQREASIAVHGHAGERHLVSVLGRSVLGFAAKAAIERNLDHDATSNRSGAPNQCCEMIGYVAGSKPPEGCFSPVWKRRFGNAGLATDEDADRARSDRLRPVSPKSALNTARYQARCP